MYYGKVSAKFLLNFANETIDWWHGLLINDFIKIPQHTLALKAFIQDHSGWV